MNYKNAYEEMKKLYELLQQKNKQLKQKNKQLKDNWNKLKQKIIDSFNKTQDVWFIDILQEIGKIEQGSNE